MVLNVIKSVKEIEDKAVNSYMHALRILRLRGIDLSDLELIIKKVLIETLIHRELLNGVIKAYEEALEKDKEVMKDIREISPSSTEKVLIVKLLREHLDIESMMVEVYNKLSNEIQYPVLKELMKSLANNEREHHRMISELIKKYESGS